MGTCQVDYTSQSTGSIDGEDNNKQEIRALFGIKQSIFSPYIGFGIRRLENDSEGMRSTTGHYGYNRVSKYYYLPIGLGIDLISNDKINIKTKLEYDHLIAGRQTSDLTYLGGQKIKNDQHDGNGYRFSLQFSVPVDKSISVFIEPFYEYWDIDDSDTYLGYYEPKNTTEEFGMKVGIGF